MVISYRGRFAPSPTGPLHFGSLVAALGSWLDARAAGGQWLVRIEDIDTPRNVPGADSAILRALEDFGLHWDGEVVYQSLRQDAYAEALEQLKRSGDVFACTCSRKDIEVRAVRRAKDGAWIYPGTCRARPLEAGAAGAWRLRMPELTLGFDDRLQGPIGENLAEAVGDVVLRRADGLYAYQLAVVVDDGWQGITDIVRGADLLGSTSRQIWLQRCLGLPEPRYMHLPVAVNAAGEKLSKQTLAPAIVAAEAPRLLRAALAFLGQPVAAELAGAPVATLLEAARRTWQPERVARCRQIASPA